jgi:hypothetical protein
MCNPPFHASMDEATKGSERKWRALGKADPKRKLPVLNFGGQSAELWCEGGEARFRDATDRRERATCPQGAVVQHPGVESLEPAGHRDRAEKAGVLESQVVEMSQGQKQSRFVAWTFQTKCEQQIWRQRWGAKAEPCGEGACSPRHCAQIAGTKNRARIAPVHGFFRCVLLVHSVGQAFGHNQLDHFLGSDFDGSASRRVTASTGRTLGHFQLADTWQSDFAAVFQLIGNDLAQLVQSARAVVFGASIASAMSAISWSLVRAIVVFLPYQIHMDCRVQCQPSSPIFWPGPRR